MIYETKIRDIVKAYKLAHIQLHSEEFLKSWGLTCYGVEIYLSNESENCDYIDVKVTDGGTHHSQISRDNTLPCLLPALRNSNPTLSTSP